MSKEMEGKHVAAVLIVMGVLSFAWVITDTVLGYKTRQSKEGLGFCPPISREQSTGTIRCYSGSHLVYENSIYYNGGILCAVSGKEIKITGGKSLCVIESWQPDNWTPPQ